MLLLSQIANHLESLGVAGGSTDWFLAKGFMPDSPEKVVAIFELPGDFPDVTRSNQEIAYDYPGFQIRVRGERHEYVETREKIQEVFGALHGNEPVASSSEPVFVYVYSMNSAPLPMGRNPNEGFEFSLNFRTMRSREEA